MKLEVNISKAKFFSILGAVLVLAGALFAYAYGTNSPSVFGHSIQEVDGITCTAGQAITRDTTGLWKCVAVGGSSSSNAWKDVSVEYYTEDCRINQIPGTENKAGCNQNGAIYDVTDPNNRRATIPISGECAGAKELLFKYYIQVPQTTSGGYAIMELIPRRGNVGQNSQYTNPAIINYQSGRVLLSQVAADAAGQTRGQFKIDVQDINDAVYLGLPTGAQDSLLFGLELDKCR